jgi:hypothetical protein
MGVFAIGAIPALGVVAAAAHSFSTTLRKHGTTFAAVFIILMGGLTILRGAGIYHFPFASNSEPLCHSQNEQVLKHY